MGNASPWGHVLVRRVDGQGAVLIQCKLLGQCEAKSGTEINEFLQAGAGGHKRERQNVKTDPGSGGWQGSGQGGKKQED